MLQLQFHKEDKIYCPLICLLIAPRETKIASKFWPEINKIVTRYADEGVAKQYIIDQFRHFRSGLALSMLYHDMSSKLVIWVNELVTTALNKSVMKGQIIYARMLFSQLVQDDETIVVHTILCIWLSIYQRKMGVTLTLVQLISLKDSVVKLLVRMSHLTHLY